MEEASRVSDEREWLSRAFASEQSHALGSQGKKDVRERLAVSLLRAIPWPKEIRMKKIENLEEALEEARTRRAIEEEEEGGRRRSTQLQKRGKL